MSHALTVQAPAPKELLLDGVGDDVVVAVCSCGMWEYTRSGTNEAEYWHSIHVATPNATPLYLLSVLVDRPMPEGWTPSVRENVAPTEPQYTCGNCQGCGTTEFYGTADGQFYNAAAIAWL